MLNNHKNKTLVILGPTSSGKSDVAIKLAKQFGGEVISADSRQVYRHMDLGTGKVRGKWKKTGHTYVKNKRYPELFISEDISHHLIDIVSPKTDYNISHFQKDCQKLIADIFSRGKIPIICGGTGFWISSVVDQVIFPQVKPNKKLRKRLEKKSTENLFSQLKKIDPARSKTIDGNNKVRLIRAIEICKTLGKVPKIANSNQKIVNSKFLQIGITIDYEELEKRIEKRLESRFNAGMVKEVKNLNTKDGLSWKKIQSFGLAYFWIPLFLQGKISEDEMKYRTLLAEKNYAKRQKTWFKRDKRIIWNNNYKKIEKLISNFL
jgi:tRNA dimethylallyltransferase